MRVLVHSSGGDTGGQGYRIESAFRDDPDWWVEAHNSSRSSLGYPEHHPLPMGERRPEVVRQFKAADVVHLRNSLGLWQQLHGAGKPVILHHHGTQFRESHGSIAYHARGIGVTQVASTIDLTLLEPDVQWLPSPYDMDELAAQRTPIEDGRIHVAHFPTSAREKSSLAFMAAMTRLAMTHPVVPVTNVKNGRVMHQPWQRVMEQKATADILYDQVSRGYGNNSVEAWGMGIPVIAGTHDPKVRATMVGRFGSLPYAEATEETLYDVLRRMVESASMRQEYAALGLAHAMRFHDSRVVKEQLKVIWSEARPTNNWPMVQSSPAWLERMAARRRVAA